MTVKELIVKLLEIPIDAKVRIVLFTGESPNVQLEADDEGHIQVIDIEVREY